MSMEVSGPPWVVRIRGGVPVSYDPLDGQMYANGSPVSGAGDGKTSPNSIIMIGDSITNNNSSSNGLVGAANFTRQFKTLDIGWWTWTNIILGGAFKVIRNSGRSGDTTGDMLSRLAADVLAYSPAWVLVAGGINDRQLGGQADLGYDYTVNNLQTIVERCTAAGVKVLLATILPNNAVNALGAGNIKVENLLRVNDWIRRYCEGKSNVICLDVFSSVHDQTTLCDGVAGTFNPPTDKTHPLVAPCWRIGTDAARVLSGVVKPRPVIASLGGIASATNPYGNLVKYPTMSGTGGTMPGVYTSTLAAVAITGTAGQFSCTATSLVVGQAITVSGTLSGTGGIAGYSSPTTYYIIATNGSTTFTLSATQGGSAITTTAGTTVGWTFAVNGSVPDGWWLQNDGAAVANAGHTIVHTRPARTDYPNLTWWQATVNWTASQNVVTVFTHRLLSGSVLTIPAGISAGDLIDCAIELEYSSVTNAGPLTVEFVARQGTTDLTFTDGQFDAGNTYSAGLVSGQTATTPTPAFAGIVTANGMPLPAGCDNIMVRVQARNLAGTVGGYTLRIGRVFVGKRL